MTRSVPTTKIDFNSHNYSHRLMLALAVRDYTNTPGHTLAGRHEEDPKKAANNPEPTRGEACSRPQTQSVPGARDEDPGKAMHSESSSRLIRKSLLKALRENGCPMSKSQLDRIVQAPHPDDHYAPYPHPRIGRRVALFLQAKGYFPPGQDIDKTLKTLPLFFDGFASGAPDLLKDVKGEYHSYHYSSTTPDTIVVGHVKIGARTEWNFARVEHTIEARYRKNNTLNYEGIAFSDEERNLYMLMREDTHRYPRFFVFDDCDRPDGKTVDAIYGSLLGAARLRKRHLSSIVLHRAHHPRPPHEITVEQASQLPVPIRRYLIP